MKLKEIKNWYTVCTGNTCRSPLLQRIILEKLNEFNLDYCYVQSRKAIVVTKENMEDYLLKNPPQEMSKGSQEIIRRKFGDNNFAKMHRSRAFTPEELKEADIVITMDHNHKKELIKYSEAFTEKKECKVYTLGELADQPFTEIKDPFHSDIFRLLAIFEKSTGIRIKNEARKLQAMFLSEGKEISLSKVKEILTQEILKGFSEEFKIQIAFEEYESTYNLLNEMTESLFKKGEARFNWRYDFLGYSISEIN